METQKVYVDVVAEFTKDGILLPRQITWEDGRKYEITRIKSRKRAASMPGKQRRRLKISAKPMIMHCRISMAGLF